MPEVTLDDILGTKATTTVGIEDILGIHKGGVRIPSEEEEMNWWNVSKEALEQLARGFVGEASMGLSKRVLEDKAPTMAGTEVSRGIGSFLGFLAVPIKGARIGVGLGKQALAKILGKQFIKSTGKGLVSKFEGRIAKKGLSNILEHLGTSTAVLGGASVLSDISNIEEMPERALGGAKIGLIFGAVGMGGVMKHKPLAWLLRQFGGRALFKIAGEYPEGYLSKDNIAQVVFHEALNTYFFSKGITMKQLWTGEVPKEVMARLEKIEKARLKYNKEVTLEAKLRVGEKDLETVATKRLPGFMDYLSSFGGKYVDPDIVSQIQATHTMFFDIKNKGMRPSWTGIPGKAIAVGEKIVSETPKPFELRYKIKNGEGTLAQVGKKVPKRDVQKYDDMFKRIIKQMMLIPTRKLPESYKKMLDNKIFDIVPGIATEGERKLTDFFYRALELNPEKLQFKDLFRIETKLHEVSEVEYGMEIDEVMRDFRIREGLETSVMEKKGMQKDQNIEKDIAEKVDYMMKERKGVWSYLRYKAKDKPQVLIQQLFTQGFWENWLDIRKTLHRVEHNTGIPIWEAFKGVEVGDGMVRQEHSRLMKDFKLIKNLPEIDQAGVRQYYFENWSTFRDNPKGFKEGREIRYIRLNKRQKQAVDLVDKLMEDLAPLVRRARFDIFYEWLQELETKTGKRQYKKVKQIYTNQDKLLPLLKEAVNVYEFHGEEALNKFLATKGKNLGLIEAGNYLPGMLSGVFNPKMHSEISKVMDALSTTHLRSRNQEYHTRADAEVAPLLRQAFFDNPLNVIIGNYTKQVLNQAFLKKPLGVFDKLVGILDADGYMSNAKATAFGKEYSFMDFMRLYAHRVRGLPVKTAGIEKFVKMAQSVFFRSLVVRPFLWMRNVFQRFVTMPHKSIMTDPRYAFKRMKDIPIEWRERYQRNVSQFESFERDWMLYEETQALRKIPLLGAFVRTAEKVGKVYPISDESNRGSIFAKTFLRSIDKIKAYTESDRSPRDWKKLKRALGVEKIDEGILEVQVKDMIDKGMVQEAAYTLGEFMATNSQWVYRRTGKSLWEMTASGESFTNLLTWSKGLSQRFLMIGKNMNEGFRRKDYGKMASAGGEMAGMMLAGYVGGEILKHISLSHAKKYTDYGLDSFVWEFGGVSFDLVRGVTEQISNLVTAYDAPPEERKKAIEDFLKYMDNMAVRQMIPFAKSALAVVESVTDRAFISPIYNAMTRRGIAKVDRTFMEGITHALFATDPNKSKAVKDWAGKAKYKFKSLAMKATNPVARAYYTARYERYKYFTDLFLRYTPLEVAGIYYQREYEKMLKVPDFDLQRFKMEEKQELSKRKAKMGYY